MTERAPSEEDALLMASPTALDEKPRSELVEEARRMGVERPERMTRVELRDEIVRRSTPEDRQAEARGLFGVARSLVASVVDKGLKFPEAAKVIRGESSVDLPPETRAPVATVTLAEIYAAQGHKQRALRVLEDVLREEPDHEEALRVQAELHGKQKTDVEIERTDRAREAATAEAPPVEEVSGATTEYVPSGNFVETTGEEVQTGQPPQVTFEQVEEPAPDLPADSNLNSDSLTGSDSDSVPASHLTPALVAAQSSSNLLLYWELPRATLEQCAVDTDEGHAAIRIVAFAPSGTAPDRRERTFAVSDARAVHGPPGCDCGTAKLPEFAEPSAVRAALGWETEDGFLPLTVGRALEEWGADRSGSEVAQRAAAHLAGD